MSLTRRTFLGGAGLAAGGLLLGAAPATAATAPLPRVPSGFRWGVACSGFQSEGYAPDSNWSRYVAAGTSSIQQPYGNSVDFLHRYPEDIGNAAALGVDTFRMGIEWARVQPRPGEWSAEGLAYYDAVLTQIRRAGMRPMVTLSHFVHPGWVADNGAWTADRTVQDYLAYVQGIVSRHRGLGITWITFNETLAYVLFELQNSSLRPTQITAMDNRLVTAHRAAYDLIHRLDPGAAVTSNIAYFAGLYLGADATFIDRVADKLDFFGLDFYYGASVTDVSALHQLTDHKLWEIRPEPEDLYWALKYYHRRFPELPIWIVENGISTDNGAPRPDGYTRTQHLEDHLYWTQRAIGDGVPVIGYNYWSITDNYEWGSYAPRFGLYTVDALTDPTLTRRPTDGVAAYRSVIASHGVPDGYRPVAKASAGSLGDLPWSLLGLTGRG